MNAPRCYSPASGVAFPVGCASSRFHLGSPLSAAGSSSDSVSQHVERMCTTSAWLVRQTCTWLIQHLLQFHRSLILISFTSCSSSSLLSSGFTHSLVTLSCNPQCVWLRRACGLFQHTLRCYFLTFLLPVVAMTKKNANAALVYSFLYKIVQVGVRFWLLPAASWRWCSPPTTSVICVCACICRCSRSTLRSWKRRASVTTLWQCTS